MYGFASGWQVSLQTINSAPYMSDVSNLTLESYYLIMPLVFNNLQHDGTTYALSNKQKISKFEAGLAEEKAISNSISAKRDYNSFVPV